MLSGNPGKNIIVGGQPPCWQSSLPWPGISEHKSLRWLNPSLLIGGSPPRLPLSHPGPSRACQTPPGRRRGVGTRIPWLSGPVHPSSTLVDRGLSQLSAWQRPGVWCGAKVAPWREGVRRQQGQERGGHSWPDTQREPRQRRNGAAAFTRQRGKLRLRGEVRGPRTAKGRDLRPGSAPPGARPPFCFVLTMGCRGAL